MAQVERSEMRTFFIVWAGQLFSLLGSGLTRFGLAFWVFGDTQSVTSLAMVILAGALPGLLIGPFAGTIVDRLDRRSIMIGADAVVAVTTLGLALLWATGNLDLWHILVLAAVGSAAESFQTPAYQAAVTLLVPKSQLNRANGLINANEAIALVTTPLLAGVLVGLIGLGGILVIDAITFGVAIATLAFVRFPAVKGTDEASNGATFLQETADGFRYLTARTGLLLFLFVAAILNFLLGFNNVLVFPLFLSFSTEAVVGAVMSAVGIAMLVGSVVASTWGGPKKRMRFILGAMVLGGFFIGLSGLRESVVWIAAWMLGFMVMVPVVNATSQALWQIKVAPEYQGRVFAIRGVIARMAMPLAFVLTGPLADNVFEPLMADGGVFAGSIGQIIGTGPGRGIALMYVLMGLGLTLTALIGFSIKQLRDVEILIPDAVSDQPATTER